MKMDLDKAIMSRVSVRKFSPKKPDWRTIIECIDAARYAPSAGGNFVLKFVMVEDPEKIKAIAESCQQDFIKEAQYVVVACSVPGRLVTSYGNDGRIYTRQQAGAGIQNFLLKLHASGLSTCWVGYFVDEEIKKTLEISKPKDVNIEGIFPIGYDDEKIKNKKNRIELDNVLYFNEWEETSMKKVGK